MISQFSQYFLVYIPANVSAHHFLLEWFSTKTHPQKRKTSPWQLIPLEKKTPEEEVTTKIHSVIPSGESECRHNNNDICSIHPRVLFANESK